jgi:ABC-type amino acid transport substrate-binding protein
MLVKLLLLAAAASAALPNTTKISSKTWDIVAPPHGVYVQYDASKSGNARFSGMSIDVLEMTKARVQEFGGNFSFNLHPPSASDGSFHGAVEEVVSGARDLIWAGARLTPARLQKGLHFTAPYSSSAMVLIRPKNPNRYSQLQFDSMAELNQRGLKACATNGTARIDFIESQFPNALAVVDPIPSDSKDLTAWRTAMDRGTCDAIVADMHDAIHLLGSEDNCDLQLVSKEGKFHKFWQGSLGVATSPTESELASELSIIINGLTTAAEVTTLLTSTYYKSSCEASSALKGRHFHIVTVEDPPQVIISTTASGNDAFSGYIPTMIKEVAARGNFSYTLHESSDGSYNGGLNDVRQRGKQNTLNLDPSPSAAAFNETIKADIFWAAAFITEARLKHAEFTSPFLDSGLVLVSRPAAGSTSSVGPAAPFTNGLWLLIFIMSFCAGIVFWLLESAPRHYPSAANPHLKFSTQMEPPFLTGPKGIAGPAQIFRSLRKNLVFTTYTAFTGVTGVRTHEPVTFAGQIFSIAFNFMCVVIISSYTANLTSFLTKEAATTEFSTIEQMVARKKTLCIKSKTAYGSYIKGEYGEQLRHGGRLKEKENLEDMIKALLLPKDHVDHCDAFAETVELANYATHVACTPDWSMYERGFGRAAQQAEATLKPCPLATAGQVFWHQNMGVGVTKDYPGVANELSGQISAMRTNAEPIVITEPTQMINGKPEGRFSTAHEGADTLSLLERYGKFWYSNGIKDKNFQYHTTDAIGNEIAGFQNDVNAVDVNHVELPLIICFAFGVLMLLKHSYDHFRDEIIYERAHRFNLPKKTELEDSFDNYSEQLLIAKSAATASKTGRSLEFTFPERQSLSKENRQNLSQSQTTMKLMSIDNFGIYFKEVEHRRLSSAHKNRSIRSMRSLFPASKGLQGLLYSSKPMISKAEFIDWMYVRGFTIEVMKAVNPTSVIEKATGVTIASFASIDRDLRKIFHRYHDLMERVNESASHRGGMLPEQRNNSQGEKTLPAYLLHFLVHEVYGAKFKGESELGATDRTASMAIRNAHIESRKFSTQTRKVRNNTIGIFRDEEHVTFEDMLIVIKDLKNGKFDSAATELFGVRKQSGAFFLRNARQESEMPGTRSSPGIKTGTAAGAGRAADAL